MSNGVKKFNLKTGKLGEKIAREYLEKRGYKVIDQNFRTKFTEIDLVAKKGKELVFIEVRTKKGNIFGTPEESLNKKKLRKLYFGARIYTSRIGWSGNFRIDAVCVELRPENSVERINHYQNII